MQYRRYFVKTVKEYLPTECDVILGYMQLNYKCCNPANKLETIKKKNEKDGLSRLF